MTRVEKRAAVASMLRIQMNTALRTLPETFYGYLANSVDADETVRVR